MDHEQEPKQYREPSTTAVPEQPTDWDPNEQVGDIYEVNLEPGRQPEIEKLKDEPSAERERVPDTPCIYVSSLADYNQGNDHGAWIDATQEPDDIRQEIQQMLWQSRVLMAEDESFGDWAIHDSSGFGLVTVHEHDDLETVSRLAQGIQEHGTAFSAWAEVYESNPEQWDLFQEAYLGEYDDLDSYGEQLWDDMGWQALIDSVLPPEVARHTLIGAHSLANDLWLGGDIQVIHKPGGGIWVFRGDI